MIDTSTNEPTGTAEATSRTRRRPTRGRAVVTGRGFGGWPVAILRTAVLLPMWFGLVSSVVGAFWVATTYVDRIPVTPDLEQPSRGRASEIHATDGTRVGGLLKGTRPHAAYEQIPPRVTFAFLAAEDDAFFAHRGYDLVAIGRAWLRNRAAGRVVEGGSTITQQLAKASLGTERSYDRKILEVLLARRIEAAYGKTVILEAYLNTVYLGAGAHGIVAASEIYFDRAPRELSWGQAAMIAGMTNSPSSRNPFRTPELARTRRDAILDRLAAIGALDERELAREKRQPLGLRADWRGDEATVPYAAVTVREHLRRSEGEDALARGGFAVTVATNPVAQKHARGSLRHGLKVLDRRQGFRGPLAALSQGQSARFAELTAERYGPDAALSPVESQPYLAQVVDVAPDEVRVLLGDHPVTISWDGLRWASPWSRRDMKNERELSDATEILSPGDVVLIAHETHLVWDKPISARRPDDEPRQVTGWRLDQTPRVEGVVATVDLDTGYARALVGGFDFDRSQYNRVIDGCRQPGSVFKPIVYSRALERGMTPATVLADAPLKIEKAGGEVWAPKNADRDFSGMLLLRDALARSRNLPTVEVFNYVGPRSAARQARRLGITTRMAETEALSLGASCVKPWDMLAVYGTFARRGRRMKPTLVVSVVDDRGEVLEDHGSYGDVSAPTSARLDRLVTAGLHRAEQVLPEPIAYQMLYLLRAVVYAGTAYAATALGVPIAGKTGTTNAFDTWFVGFSESLLTVVWVGADNNDRALGKRETGGRVALPIWMSTMKRLIDGRAQGGIIGPPPAEIEIVRIDRELGLRSQEGEPGVDLPFRRGTAPTEYAPSRTAKAIESFDREASTF